MMSLSKPSNSLTFTFFAFLIVLTSACKKDDVQTKPTLFNAEYRNLRLKSGFTNTSIPITGKDWSVAYVKDAVSGELLLDKAGSPVVLKTSGSVELQMGWLKMERKQGENALILSLKENFDITPRKFLIGILSDGNRDELSFTQTRGEGYELVKKEIIEIPGSRQEYTNEEGLHKITISNNDWVSKYLDITDIYKDVQSISEFNSDDPDAFRWVNGANTPIFIDDIIRNNVVYWSRSVAYKQGKSFEPYISFGGKIEMLVQANSTVKISGEMLYLKRECAYTFTIKNTSSGNLFEVSGTWKQVVPISTSTKIYDSIPN